MFWKIPTNKESNSVKILDESIVYEWMNMNLNIKPF